MAAYQTERGFDVLHGRSWRIVDRPRWVVVDQFLRLARAQFREILLLPGIAKAYGWRRWTSHHWIVHNGFDLRMFVTLFI